MTADSDRLAAVLAQIREHNERHIKAMAFTEWTVQREPCGNVRLLLAAVEAVLALAASPERDDCDLDGNPEQPLVRLVRCDELLAAISAALPGEEAGP